MTKFAVLLGLFSFGMASGLTVAASAETYPLPEERTRQNLNTAIIEGHIIRALPDPTGVLAGKGSVGAPEYDELIRLLMDDYVGDEAIGIDAFLLPYPEKYKERYPQKLMIAEMKRLRERPIPYACRQERFHHIYLMEFLPSNINNTETI